MSEGLTFCSKCGCMTRSIRKGRAHYICGKCSQDKSLSDFLYFEALERGKALTDMTERQLRMQFSDKKVDAFLKWMNGKTVGIRDDGSAFFYADDIDKFFRRREK